MRRLILFDVDGTLVDSPTSSAAVAAIRQRYGLETSLDGIRLGGLTEPEILTLLLQSAGWEEIQIEKELPNLIKELGALYAQEFQKGSIKLLPGVKDLLDNLIRPDIILGLITGNLKSRAEMKLTDVGIWHYFSVGGYGDDQHLKRSDLVKIAVKRAGFKPSDSGVYVIGDTWRDIKAAVEAGVINRVGLISPRHLKKEFEEAGANIILPGFTETEKVLEALGIPGTPSPQML